MFGPWLILVSNTHELLKINSADGITVQFFFLLRTVHISMHPCIRYIDDAPRPVLIFCIAWFQHSDFEVNFRQRRQVTLRDHAIMRMYAEISSATLSCVLTVPYVSLKDVHPPMDFAMLCLITTHHALALGLIDHLRGKADGNAFLLRNLQRSASA